MRGTDAKTGKELTGLAHLRQSVVDILTTPIGSRVGRRDYGSNLFEIIDKPMNRSTVMDLYAATAESLSKWEKRIDVTGVNVVRMPEPGVVEIDVTGVYLPDGKAVTIEGIVVR